MASKKSYTSNILIICTVLMFGYIIGNPFLPIRTETKLSLGYPEHSLLNFTELASKYGYLSEEHRVVTDDGYILGLFRIIQGRNCDKIRYKTPVILMHGLLQSADVWLDAGPKAGLAYLLADACYDLWVGNQRGNYYSRRHETLDPNEDEFWQFSIDEIGFYDIPAIIDYVLDYTGEKHVNYIGFSQGSGTFYIMCSERPGYCKKVSLLVSLAPAARQTHTRSVPYRSLVKGVENMATALAKFGVQEVFSKDGFGQEFMAFLCQFPRISDSVCMKLEAMFDSNHPGSISNDTMRALFGHFPAGTSLKNMVRYGQSMTSERFEKFSYGYEQNLRIYGSEYPPEYNLSAVSVPVVILYGKNDYMVDPEDVKWLMRKLPNVVEAKEVRDPLWNHLDVTYSQYTSVYILPTVNEYLMKYSHF